MAKILLIRHGETEDGPQISYNSKSKSHLNENGKKQALKLGKYLAENYSNLAKIYSSALPRSVETAEIVAGFFRKKIITDSALNEVDFGIFEGLTLTQAEEKYPEQFFNRKKDKLNFQIPEGESYKQAYLRIKPFFDKLFASQNAPENEVVAVITHATIIKIIAIYYLNLNLQQVEKIFLHNCGLTVLETNKGDVLVKKFNVSKPLEEDN